MLKKDEAVCIRTVDYSETSQVVTVFTRNNGKVRAIAKGSKRRKSAFGGAIEILSFGKAVFSESPGGLSTLTEFEPRPAFSALRGRLFVLNCCLFAAELLDCFTEQADPHPELFDDFVGFLQNAQDSQGKSETLGLLAVFQLALLERIGSGPVLGRCANCKNVFSNKWQDVYFSSSANGLICRDCEAGFADRMRLTAAAAQCLANLRLIGQADEKVLNEIKNILVYHFTELLGRPPKMAKFIVKSI